MKKVAFHTLGCKLNFSETSSISRQFADAGYERVDFSSGADFYVINTCSVTENADKECRTIVNRAISNSPDAKIIITGCYAQLKPDYIATIPGVDMVLGAAEKFNIVAHLDKLSEEGTQVFACEIADVNSFNSSWSEGDRTRSFLKVQDGCDYSCSFCTIPLARGKSRSNNISNVVHTARAIAATGTKEIVLTGVNLGDFGIDTDGKRITNFYNLISELDKVEGIERFRISSIEPNLLTDEIITFVAGSQKFVPHFHIPLQSGSDRILKLMRRRYLTPLYRSRVELIKKLMPHCSVGVDVIVGFPGETEEDFLQTYNFLNSIDISYLHVFTYSERENTLAVEMNDAVPFSTRKQRNRMLRILSEKKLRSFYQKFVGETATVLFEGDNKKGFMHGYTENYLKVKTSFDPTLINTLQRVQLTGLDVSGEMTTRLLPDFIALQA
ncbi:MAG: tRNA (N(6)-L-threonylcarbamoyladenosine(37)-C(2))-methylthiotransferase MtaB [Bacteroidia bacterium]